MAHQEHSDGKADFAHNPFAALDKSQFPGKRGGQGGAARPRPHSVPDACKPRKRRPEPADDAEAALFLAAMSRVEKAPAAKTAPGGFSLSEQGSLADALRKSDRKKPHAGSAKAGEPPLSAPAQEPPASPAMCDDAADAEEDAFLLAMRQVAPLAGKGRAVAPPVNPLAPPPSADTSLQDFLDGKLEFALSFTDEYLEGHVVGLDPLIMGKLRSGSLSPEAHLDLHGLNVMQAFETLRGFMRGSWYKGLRTVLLVPGRGRNSPDGVGVLRGKLQTWLTQDPFKRVVLAFCTAQPHDGGPGSIYVLLRKFRKKGRICWERMPADADLF